MGFDRAKEFLESCFSLVGFRSHLSRLMIDDSTIF